MMPSDAFSASLTTADACKRRTRGRIAATYAARASSLVCLAALAAFTAATCAGKAVVQPVWAAVIGAMSGAVSPSAARLGLA